MSSRVVSLLALLPALLALAASCSDMTTPDNRLTSGGNIRRVVLPGLEQQVTVSPAELVTGENVQIQSVITNRGGTPIGLESRVCGLDLAGDLQLTTPPDLFTCDAFSVTGAIAPGESRVSGDIRRVVSSPGTYTLRVRQALRPEAWVELRVVVRAR